MPKPPNCSAIAEGASLLTFTLDTNCLIAIDEGRPEAPAIRKLADAHTAGRADVAVVAISASENQKDGRRVQTFDEFRERLSDLALSHLAILQPMLYFDITFWDWSLWSDDAMLSVEKQIHSLLFPNVEFAWQDYCRAHDIASETHPAGRWRNCKCDVQAMWSHIHGQRDVFVTTDSNFHAVTKKAPLIELGAKKIAHPGDAISLL